MLRFAPPVDSGTCHIGAAGTNDAGTGYSARTRHEPECGESVRGGGTR
jgi:hypothetical protein